MELRERPVRAAAVTLELPPGSQAGGNGGGLVRLPVTVRNGLPEFVPYQRRARSYPWAQRALAAAEATYGPPVPVCAGCGGELDFGRGASRHGSCTACG